MITKKDGPIVVAMPDHPPDGLVHSPGCLLPVPVVPREELKGAPSLSFSLPASLFQALTPTKCPPLK